MSTPFLEVPSDMVAVTRRRGAAEDRSSDLAQLTLVRPGHYGALIATPAARSASTFSLE
jgi:hypothetical protein